MNDFEYFKNIEKDLQRYVSLSIDKVNQKDQKIKDWLKSLPDTSKHLLRAGYSRPNKWGLKHVLEFFERHPKKTDTVSGLLDSNKMQGFEPLLDKLDGTYGAHSFFNVVTLQELEQRFNDLEQFKSVEDFLSFTRDEAEKFNALYPDNDNVTCPILIEEYYRAMYAVLQSSTLIVFGLNTVSPRNFLCKMPYCYEVNILVVPPSIEIPREFFKDAIQYTFTEEARIPNLVSAFYPEESDESF